MASVDVAGVFTYRNFYVVGFTDSVRGLTTDVLCFSRDLYGDWITVSVVFLGVYRIILLDFVYYPLACPQVADWFATSLHCKGTEHNNNLLSTTYCILSVPVSSKVLPMICTRDSLETICVEYIIVAIMNHNTIPLSSVSCSLSSIGWKRGYICISTGRLKLYLCCLRQVHQRCFALYRNEDSKV